MHSCPVCGKICLKPGAVMICLSLHKNINWNKVSKYKYLTKEIYELIEHEILYYEYY